MISNSEIARVFSEIAEYLEMQNVPFKPRAYEKVAEVIEGISEEISELYKRGGLKALEEIPGVGLSIAEKIEELLKTGRSKQHEALKKELPVDLSSFNGVEGLGPKGIFTLYKKLGIRNLKDLEKAAKVGKIRKIEGFGEKSEENILKGIEFTKKSGGRFVLGSIMPKIREIENRLKNLKEVQKIMVAGSVRRRKETIGDCDILVISEKPKSVMDYFISMPEVARVFAHGETKSAVKLANGLDVDLRVVQEKSYGAALNYFTGSKDHNIALREIAIKKGYKLNEYGIFSTKGGSLPAGGRGASGGKGFKQIAGRTEEEIYKNLGLEYIEPEMRENTGEIELAKEKKLPKLINYGDLKGDLQIQTNWTDGANSIEEMAEAAVKLGLKYIAITDHTKRLAMIGGLDEKKIKRQWKEIDAMNKKMAGKIKILKGTECDILKDGTLDLPDKILEKLDVVGVSIHSYFNLSRADQTKRIERAIRNKNVDILFHPTGRIINKRPAYELDLTKIIKTAKETGTVLEIDAFPDRLDLKDNHIRQCVEARVKLTIDSDAHSINHLSYLEYGLAQARRGWAKKNDIINTWEVKKMMSFLKK
ncbi:MAG: DNA polymerase/3'-5' exonuclease PolX [Patescibacteria group bacterium]